MSPATLRTLSFIARSVVIGLAAAFLLSVLAPSLVSRLRGGPAEPHASRAALVGRTQGPVSYAEAVQKASPAVVNIYANKVTTYLPRQELRDSLTMRLLGIVQGRPFRKLQQNLGSGVIFSEDGYVLTNNHVIAGADDIQVALDNNSAARAQVVGTDPETDLAVLRIDAKNLPTIDVADDSAVDVGDVVLAIGNPIGIGKTVTMGIVSGTGRQLRMSAYEDFIQTDAAINAGNSGGALVNALGELVGINTAVYPRTPTSDGRTYTPGAEGIGFAIPVATAKTVLDQIVKHGKVIRGWIGADYTDVPPQLGNAAPRAGVYIARVIPESPAAETGLEPGDILTTIDGTPIVDAIDLTNREAAIAPGTKVHLEGVRKNAPFSTDLTLVQRPPPSTTGA
jgi:serine protease DegS/serine protease DegQ